MAYLDNTRPDFKAPFTFTVCLSAVECRLLLPEMKASLKRETKRYEKYKDIHEGGEATERQQTLLFEAEEKVQALESVIYNCEELIKANKK